MAQSPPSPLAAVHGVVAAEASASPPTPSPTQPLASLPPGRNDASEATLIVSAQEGTQNPSSAATSRALLEWHVNCPIRSPSCTDARNSQAAGPRSSHAPRAALSAAPASSLRTWSRNANGPSTAGAGKNTPGRDATKRTAASRKSKPASVSTQRCCRSPGAPSRSSATKCPSTRAKCPASSSRAASARGPQPTGGAAMSGNERGWARGKSWTHTASPRNSHDARLRFADVMPTRRRSSNSSSKILACTERIQASPSSLPSESLGLAGRGQSPQWQDSLGSRTVAGAQGKCTTTSSKAAAKSASICLRSLSIPGQGCMQSVMGVQRSRPSCCWIHWTSSRRSKEVSRAARRPLGSWFSCSRAMVLRFASGGTAQRSSSMGSSKHARARASASNPSKSRRSSAVSLGSSSSSSSPATQFNQKPRPSNHDPAGGTGDEPLQAGVGSASPPWRPGTARLGGGGIIAP
mmetsp:Transcript_11707/g.31551  ORF Transcript_11707/g.31551 Transcript_11707/m.31551 type:complete len:464 (-) Transcript_11707:37-1428(-)